MHPAFYGLNKHYIMVHKHQNHSIHNFKKIAISDASIYDNPSFIVYINGLVQDCGNPWAIAMGLLQFCAHL